MFFKRCKELVSRDQDLAPLPNEPHTEQARGIAAPSVALPYDCIAVAPAEVLRIKRSGLVLLLCYTHYVARLEVPWFEGRHLVKEKLAVRSCWLFAFCKS